MRKLTKRSALRQAQNDPSNTSINFENDMSDASVAASSNSSAGSSFITVIVEEVISDPQNYFNKGWPETNRTYEGQPVTIGQVFSGDVTTDDNGDAFVNTWGAENPTLVNLMPANSIKGFIKSSKNSGGAAKSIICFPFFSSHLSMPVKPGETVIAVRIDNIYYWMTRKPAYRQVEDVNYTFNDREANFNSVRNTSDESTYAHFTPVSTSGKSIDFQNIINTSISYKEEFTGEPVPRHTKDCGDFLIQGSNNTHIHLGKEKFEIENTVSPEVFTTAKTADDTIGERKPTSPAVDICVLRKKEEIFDLRDAVAENDHMSSISTETDGLGAVTGVLDDPKIRYYENEKARDFLKKEVFFNEFYDSDIYNCAARVYLTNSKSIDEILFANDYEGEADMSASPADILGIGDYGAAVSIAANNRVIGTETIKIQNIAGSSGIQFTSSGDVIIFGNSEGGAKIVLEASGDIRIVPGESGILKLGSDDAIGGLVAASTSARVEGSVESPPIITTAGGFVSSPGVSSTGMFSNKVLVAVSLT